jgi:hypothetical protein
MRIEKRSPSLRNSPAAMSSIIHHIKKEDAKNAGIIAGRVDGWKFNYTITLDSILIG